MRLLQFCATLIVIASFLSTNTYAQYTGIGGHSRLSDMGNAEANGGNDTSLIGLNTNGINNFGINQWDLSEIAGDIVTEVTLTFAYAVNYTNVNHGSDVDTFSIHEVYSTNAGWLEGGQIINSSNVETNGAVTYNFQSQTSETTGTPWQDASGVNVANLLGAFDPTPIDTVPAFNEGDGPARVEFTVPIATVQAWVDDPASFAGIVLLANDVDNDSRTRFNFFGNPAELSINRPPFLLGDVDIDGDVDFADIPAFIAVLQASGFQAEADCDGSDEVDFADIPAFIEILMGA